MPEFLDLTHRYVLLVTDEDRHAQLNQSLIGPPRITRPSTVDPKVGFTPPSWWRGDEYASRNAVAAMSTLRRKR